MVSRLKSQEKDLKKQMVAKQKQDQKLSGAIFAAIRRATDAARKEGSKKSVADVKTAAADRAASKTTSPSSGDNGNTASLLSPVKPKTAPTVFEKEEDVRLSGSFEKNKGHLPWPVSSGYHLYGIRSTRIYKRHFS